jgi:hypothetical protein
LLEQFDIPQVNRLPQICDLVVAVGFIDISTYQALRRPSSPGLQRYGAAREFIDDLAERLANRVQLTSDGHKAYLKAVGDAFGVASTTRC